MPARRLFRLRYAIDAIAAFRHDAIIYCHDYAAADMP